MWNRNSTNRVRAVSRTASVKQTSHAGKNEPKMSTEGALEQLASGNAESEAKNPSLTVRRFPVTRMVKASSLLVESNRPFGTPHPLKR
jgi:hypothetical protein